MTSTFQDFLKFATPKKEMDDVLPILPDDIMRIVFKECSDEDREAVSTTCKRFRALDFDVGARTFEKIDITWGLFNREIEGIRSGIPGYEVDLTKRRDYYTNIFKHAKTTRLEITVLASGGTQVIANLIRTISFDELMITAYNVKHFEGLIEIFENGHKLDNVAFDLNLYWDSSPKNVQRTNELLMKLPKMKKLSIIQTKIMLNEDCFVYLTSLTNILYVGMIQCSAQAILNSFEEVCRSTIASKEIEFLLETTVANVIFATHTPTFEKTILSPEDRMIIHQESNAVLWISTDLKNAQITKISMEKKMNK